MLLPFPVPRSYFDHMYHRLPNGQVWELSPTQVNFTNSELNFHFSPRSAVLLYAFNLVSLRRKDNLWTFPRCRHQWLLDSGPNQLLWVTRPYLERVVLWLLFFVHFGSMPIRFESSTLLGEATLQGLYFSIMQGLTFWKFWNTFIDSETISTFACWCICPVPERLWNWYSLHLESFARQLRCFWSHQGRI
jgi:hypothetical protein